MLSFYIKFGQKERQTDGRRKTACPQSVDAGG